MSNDKTENTALRNYIKYIRNRLRFLKTDIVNYDTNEIHYYKFLLGRVKKWFDYHLIYCSYMKGQLTIKECARYFGVSERTTYRMLRKQRKALLSNIASWEKELEGEYPF